jgi:hypothetical protein
MSFFTLTAAQQDMIQPEAATRSILKLGPLRVANHQHTRCTGARPKEKIRAELRDITSAHGQ